MSHILILHYCSFKDLINIFCVNQSFQLYQRREEVSLYTKLNLRYQGERKNSNELPQSREDSTYIYYSNTLLVSFTSPDLLLSSINSSLPYLRYLDLSSAWPPHTNLDNVINSLSKFHHLTYLALPTQHAQPPVNGDIAKISFNHSSLTYLSIQTCVEITSIDSLSLMTSLKNLSLIRLRPSLLSQQFLISLQNLPLHVLRLDYTGVSSLNHLNSIHYIVALQFLTLEHAKNIPVSVCSSIGALPNLDKLIFIRCTFADDLMGDCITALSAAKCLDYLSAPLTPTSATSLPLFKRLTSLSCNDHRGIGYIGLSAVSQLENLVSFCSNGGGMREEELDDKSISQLQYLTKLKYLRLLFCSNLTGTGFCVSDQNLSWTNLTDLTLSYCTINDAGLISISTNLKQLQTLTLKFIVSVFQSEEEEEQFKQQYYDQENIRIDTTHDNIEFRNKEDIEQKQQIIPHIRDRNCTSTITTSTATTTSTSSFSSSPSFPFLSPNRYIRSSISRSGFSSLLLCSELVKLSVYFTPAIHLYLPYKIESNAFDSLFNLVPESVRRTSTSASPATSLFSPPKLVSIRLSQALVNKSTKSVMERWKLSEKQRKLVLDRCQFI